RLWLDEEPPRDSPMLVEGAHRKQSCRVSDESDRLELDSDALALSMNKGEWSLTVRPNDCRPIFEQRWDDRQIRGAVTLPTGYSPKEIISRYAELTGRATVPPRWSFGVWWSRCMYRNREQVEGIVERLRELDIPGDVVHLDPLWLKGRKDKRLDGCHFEWDEDAFPDPQGFVDWLGERGFKLSLWEIPYVYNDSKMAREGEANGYFARDPDGGPATPLAPGAAWPPPCVRGSA